MKIWNFEKKGQEIFSRWTLMQKFVPLCQKNEATMQKTAITKKIEEIKGNNSAKKWKLKILKKRPRDIH